jgi:hypothetical protein
MYQWICELDGSVIDTPPAYDDIPWLPDAWLAALTEPEPPKRNGADLGPQGATDLLSACLTEGEMSQRVAFRLAEALTELYGPGSRHDAMVDRTLGLLRYGKQGDPGVLRALQALRQAFGDVAEKTNREGGRATAVAEFNRMVAPKEPKARQHLAELLSDPSYDDTAWAATPGQGQAAQTGSGAIDPAGDSDGTAEPADIYEQRVRATVEVLRIRAEARRRVGEQLRPAVEYPPVRSLDALLAEPFPPQRYRIRHLAPANGRVLLSAQYKAGKTTLVGNLMRSLADATPFLGAYTVDIPAAAIVLIDDEMSERTVAEWLTDQNIRNTGAVVDVITLRGNVGAFNLLDEHCRAQWARRLAELGCDYLILDCLRPVLDALGLDENHDAGRFLVAFGTLMADAGIPDACLVQHMGHSGERARGDSRFQDWPDALWRLVREDDNPNSARYFSAYGRDVDVPETQLEWGPAERSLTMRRVTQQRPGRGGPPRDHQGARRVGTQRRGRHVGAGHHGCALRGALPRPGARRVEEGAHRRDAARRSPRRGPRSQVALPPAPVRRVRNAGHRRQRAALLLPLGTGRRRVVTKTRLTGQKSLTCGSSARRALAAKWPKSPSVRGAPTAHSNRCRTTVLAQCAECADSARRAVCSSARRLSREPRTTAHTYDQRLAQQPRGNPAQ